jgi:hypothetical protein
MFYHTQFLTSSAETFTTSDYEDFYVLSTEINIYRSCHIPLNYIVNKIILGAWRRIPDPVTIWIVDV